jgi:hypothetical protein
MFGPGIVLRAITVSFVTGSVLSEVPAMANLDFGDPGRHQVFRRAGFCY